MRLRVKTDAIKALALVLFLTFSERMAFSETLVCDDPPGGTITCEAGQEPICRIRTGKIQGECKTPPAQIKNRNELEAWGLSQVLKKPVSVKDIKRPANAEILQQGRYKTGKEDTKFKLPEMTPQSDSQ